MSFRISLEEDNVPAEWRSANVVSIFKKGKRDTALKSRHVFNNRGLQDTGEDNQDTNYHIGGNK